MTASPPLIRKLQALTNRVVEALSETVGTELRWHFDALVAMPWFERWVKIRAELIATEPELDEIPMCVVPTPIRDKETSWGWFEGRGYIDRNTVIRMHKDMKDVWDILNHPSRQISRVSIDREGVFVGGQPFDAMLAITSIIRAATTSVIVVDGYVSEHTISLLGVKAAPVTGQILTRPQSANSTLVTAARTFNAQYSVGPPLEVRTSGAFHDRFILVDYTDCYHFGHSLKDAARRQVFMFSRIEEPAVVNLLRTTVAKEWAAAAIVTL